MPTSLVTAVYGIPRSTDVAVTVAPATAPPLESVIVPVMVAVTSCAKATLPPQITPTSVKQKSANAKDCNFLITLLLCRLSAPEQPLPGRLEMNRYTASTPSQRSS